MIDFSLRRATNVHWQALDVSKMARAQMKGQKPAILWFTGLSGWQMALPSLIPQALARGFHPSLSLALIAGDAALTFSCEAARPNDLIVGVTFGQGKPAAGVDACTAST